MNNSNENEMIETEILIENTEIYEPKVDYKSDRMLTIDFQRPIVLTLFILGFICPIFFLINRLIFHRTNNLFAYHISRTSCSLFGFVCILFIFGVIVRVAR